MASIKEEKEHDKCHMYDTPNYRKGQIIKYNTPAYMRFVDLTKAFDKIRLEDVTKSLKEKKIPPKMLNKNKDRRQIEPIETRADTNKTKQALATSEMKIIRARVGKARLHKKR